MGKCNSSHLFLFISETSRNTHISKTIRRAFDVVAIFSPARWANAISKLVQAVRIFDVTMAATDLSLSLAEESLLQTNYGQDVLTACTSRSMKKWYKKTSSKKQIFVFST